jgi:hypothetical protein
MDNAASTHAHQTRLAHTPTPSTGRHCPMSHAGALATSCPCALHTVPQLLWLPDNPMTCCAPGHPLSPAVHATDARQASIAIRVDTHQHDDARCSHMPHQSWGTCWHDFDNSAGPQSLTHLGPSHRCGYTTPPPALPTWNQVARYSIHLA